MTKELLFEIGTEEIPARFIQKTKSDMKSFLEKKLKELRVNYKDIEIKCTPRRFAIFISEMASMQQTMEEELKGPAKKIALDAQGNPSKALTGFLKGKGADVKDVYYKQSGKEEYAYVKVVSKGQETKLLLKEIFEEMIKSVTFPKSMRWGGKNIRFVRPIRWLLCLMDEETMSFDIEGIHTSNRTKGHRFMGSSDIIIDSPADYARKLRDNYVILDDEERKRQIRMQCENVAASLHGKLVMDEELLEEVNYIVEYPTAFYGEFDESYLSLPEEVIITPMKEHQRYFPVTDMDGRLMNKFITVRNGDKDFIENVKRGNEKVLDARLSDALFFYTEDTKKPLEAYVEKLDGIVFQQKLGNLLDKTNRIEKLALKIAEKMGVTSADLPRAARLCKADLTTSVVFEFTELQGIMGRYYAKHSKETDAVAQAIFEHYLPRFAGDDLPKSNEGIILSMADKLDSLAGFFAVDIRPTGSQDPYALRRQALGILHIIIGNRLDIKISELIVLALDGYDNLTFDKDAVYQELMNFFALRFKNLLSDMGIRYDVVDAVLGIDADVYDLSLRAKELDAWVRNQDISAFMNAFSRVSNIAKDAKAGPVREEFFKDDKEKLLWESYCRIVDPVEKYLAEKEYVKALDILVSIKDEIDAFFDSVMVMDKDENIRMNRLHLLSNIRDTMLQIADISKLVN